MKKALLFVLFFAFCVNGLEAQWISHTYHRERYNLDRGEDPIKDFLGDFNAAHPEINNSVIVGNDSGWMKSAIGELKYLSVGRGYTRVRKTVYDADTKKHKYTDSITLDRKDLELILEQLRKSKTVQWHQDYFPGHQMVDAVELNVLCKKDKQAFKKTGAWGFSLPTILRDGKILVCYDMYFCGDECGRDELVVYEEVQGQWQEFGTVFHHKF
jgi:hypothetical protein